MKYVKMLGLAVAAAAALMAFVGAGTASATGTACSVAPSPTTGPCPSASRWAVNTVIDFSLESGTSANLTDTEGTTLDTCTSATVKGKLTSNAGGTNTTTGENTQITWGSTGTACTNTTTTTKLGKLKIKAEDDNGNGILVADEEIQVTIQVPFGDCLFSVAAGTELGTVKEGTGTNATFTANATGVKLAGGGFGCAFAPETSLWSAKYVMTEPSNTTLWVATS